MTCADTGTIIAVEVLVEQRQIAPVRIFLVKAVGPVNRPAAPALAELAQSKGWLDLPEERFKTQVGRNYDLFGCTGRQAPGSLFGRVDLWAAWLDLAERHPVLRRFHRPRFHGMRHLAEQGELPPANFDACPATKTEWAFAPDGGLYGCTATVGNPRYRPGSFHPEVVRDEKAIARWHGRNVLTMSECRGCPLGPVCGGGCGAVAAARTGDPMQADCRPVRELLGMGARYYQL